MLALSLVIVTRHVRIQTNTLARTVCIIETPISLPTVLGYIYELLGVLGEVHPSEMVNNSDKLYKAYLGELKGQVKTSHLHLEMRSCM